LSNHGGQPQVTLHGGALEVANKLGIQQVRISISHCRSHATAFAIACGANFPVTEA
jgi:holo-[acyl-carrier protein] synthase